MFEIKKGDTLLSLKYNPEKHEFETISYTVLEIICTIPTKTTRNMRYIRVVNDDTKQIDPFGKSTYLDERGVELFPLFFLPFQIDLILQ